jgi:hypothetical protein
MRLNRLNIVNKYSAGASFWSDFWIAQGIFYELWDIDRLDEDGNAPGLIRGDILTIGGTEGDETYQVPDTTPYKNADTDKIWFNASMVRRLVTKDELTGYDLPRTIVKYLGEDPFTVEALGILNLSAVIQNMSDALITKFYNDFKLNPWWDNEWLDAGEIKENRAFEQTLWTP